MSSVAAEPPSPTTLPDQILHQQQQPPSTTLPSTPTPTPVPSLPDTTTTTTTPSPAIPAAAVKMTHGSAAAGPGPLEAGAKGVPPAKGGLPATKGSSKLGMLYHVTRGQPTNYDMVRGACALPCAVLPHIRCNV